MYEKRSLESSETPVLYRGSAVLKVKLFMQASYVHSDQCDGRRCLATITFLLYINEMKLYTYSA